MMLRTDMGPSRRSILTAVTLVAAGGPARGQDAGGAPTCTSPPIASPVFETQIPANLPAFLFWPAGHSTGAIRLIDEVGLTLREENGDLVPIKLELLPDRGPVLDEGGPMRVRYVIRPQRALRTASATLSFDDDCTDFSGGPVVAPHRNERYKYTIGPPFPLPRTIGTAQQVRFLAIDPLDCALRRVDFAIDLDPQLAAFPLVRMEVIAPDGRSLEAGFNRYDPKRAEGGLTLACDPTMHLPWMLRPGESVVTIAAEVLGAAPLPPLTLNLVTTCGRTAGMCDLPDAGPDAPPAADARAVDLELAHDATGPDAAPPTPDAAPPTPDASASDAAVAGLSTQGCGCRLGGRAPVGPPLVLAAVALLTWGRRRRTASRRTAGRPCRCTRSAG
jgi:hypothetical protein